MQLTRDISNVRECRIRRGSNPGRWLESLLCLPLYQGFILVALKYRNIRAIAQPSWYIRMDNMKVPNNTLVPYIKFCIEVHSESFDEFLTIVSHLKTS